MASQAIHDIAPREPPSPPRDAKVPRPGLRAGDICVGCIVWLPSRKSKHAGIKCNKDACCGHAELGDGGYDHPVLVLNIKQRDESNIAGDLICSVAIMSTYKSTPLETFLKKRVTHSHYRHAFPLRCLDRPPIDSLGLLSPLPQELSLEARVPMQKQSYVQTEHIYDVPRKVLRQYNQKFRAYKLRIAKESYDFLTRELSLPSEIFHDTDTLWETADARLAALAGKSTTSITPHHQHPNFSANTRDEDPLLYPNSSRPSLAPQSYPQPAPNRLQFAPAPLLEYSALPPSYMPLRYTQQQQQQQHEARNYGTLPITNLNYSAWQQQQQLQSRIDARARARLLESSGGESEDDDDGIKGLFATCVIGFVVVLGWAWWRASK